MAAGTYHIMIEQGATFRLRLTCKVSATELYDFTDHIARMQIRTKVTSPATIHVLTTENGGIVLGDGTIDLYISAEDTASFEFRSAVYDLEIQGVPDGDVIRLLQGQVRISPEVTR